jgi:hypothetical protein
MKYFSFAILIFGFCASIILLGCGQQTSTTTTTTTTTLPALTTAEAQKVSRALVGVLTFDDTLTREAQTLKGMSAMSVKAQDVSITQEADEENVQYWRITAIDTDETGEITSIEAHAKLWIEYPAGVTFEVTQEAEFDYVYVDLDSDALLDNNLRKLWLQGSILTIYPDGTRDTIIAGYIDYSATPTGEIKPVKIEYTRVGTKDAVSVREGKFHLKWLEAGETLEDYITVNCDRPVNIDLTTGYPASGESVAWGYGRGVIGGTFTLSGRLYFRGDNRADLCVLKMDIGDWEHYYYEINLDDGDVTLKAIKPFWPL